jgi:hypothetical protein
MEMTTQQLEAMWKVIYETSHFSDEPIHIERIEMDHVRSIYVRQYTLRFVIDMSGNVTRIEG